MSRISPSALAAVLVLAAGAAAARWIVATAPPPPAAPAPRPKPVPVTLAEAQPVAATFTLTAQGLAVPVRRTAVTPEVGGRVERVSAVWRSGFAVAAGEELLAVDPHDAAQAHLSAEAAVETAEVELRRARLHLPRARAAADLAAERLALADRERERWERLAEQGQAEATRVDAAAAARLAAAVDEETARAALLAAEAALPAAEQALRARQAAESLARTTLQRTVVRSPFAGTLTSDGPAVGALIAAGAPLGELLDLARLRVDVHLPVADAAELALDGGARLRGIPGADGERPAKVIAIAPLADALTRSVRVTVEADQSWPRPVPVGAAIEVLLELPARAEALLVPNAALGADEGGAFVYVVEARAGGALVAVKRAVLLGRAHGAAREVQSGLAPGERFVLAPVRLLGDGALVSVEAAEAP